MRVLEVDERAAEEEMRRNLVQQILGEREQLQQELDRINGAADDEPAGRNGSLSRQQGSGNRRMAENRSHLVGFSTRNDSTPPEVVLRKNDRNRFSGRTAEPPAANRSAVDSRFSADRFGPDGISSVSPIADNLLRKVREKLFGGVTRKPETDRRTQPVLDSSSRRWCSVYNTTPEVAESFDCVRLLIKPPTSVCLFADSADVHVSRHVRHDGLWEPHIVRLLQNLLFQNADLALIDIGAHIGQYSMLAACMGRQVVAVEPHRPSLRRLHKAIKINNVQQQVISVQFG